MIGGKAIAVIGMTGAGKSTFVKRLITGVHPDRLFIYDVNREYYADDIPLPKISEFVNEVYTQREIVSVFEEATIFFSNKGGGESEEMKSILVEKRHRKNTIILVFHSVQAIPLWIKNLINFVVLLRTNDEENYVRLKFPTLLPALQDIRAGRGDIIVTPNGLRLPYKIVQLN